MATERALTLHRFPDGYQVFVETDNSPGRKAGRINWNATVAEFGLGHADLMLDRGDIDWVDAGPGTFGDGDLMVPGWGP